MAKWAQCDECKSEAFFEALVDANGEIYNVYKNAFCPKCSESGYGEIQKRYRIVCGSPPAGDKVEES